MSERPFLTARWTDLVVLNFAVPADLIAGLAPKGTEPDLYAGQAYLSIVGFQFQNVRVLGVPIPGHTRFDEINLRYYVKRVVDGETRRGVIFVREIVPRRAVALIANLLYYENYVTHPMRHAIHRAGDVLAAGDTVEYAWCTKRTAGGAGQGDRSREVGHAQHLYWNRLAARVGSTLELPPAGSLEEFIVEHYWGYSRGRDGRAHEYRVAHPPWRVARAESVTWDCDLAATYDAPFAEYLAVPPVSALIAEGSAIQVFRGRRV